MFVLKLEASGLSRLLVYCPSLLPARTLDPKPDSTNQSAQEIRGVSMGCINTSAPQFHWTHSGRMLSLTVYFTFSELDSLTGVLQLQKTTDTWPSPHKILFSRRFIYDRLSLLIQGGTGSSRATTMSHRYGHERVE